jgi:hypothetical protein
MVLLELINILGKFTQFRRFMVEECIDCDLQKFANALSRHRSQPFGLGHQLSEMGFIETFLNHYGIKTSHIKAQQKFLDPFKANFL